MDHTVHLYGPKGVYVEEITLRIDVTCNSDAAQRLPKLVIMHEGKCYGFWQLGSDYSSLFIERTVICV